MIDKEIPIMSARELEHLSKKLSPEQLDDIYFGMFKQITFRLNKLEADVKFQEDEIRQNYKILWNYSVKRSAIVALWTFNAWLIGIGSFIAYKIFFQ